MRASKRSRYGTLCLSTGPPDSTLLRLLQGDSIISANHQCTLHFLSNLYFPWYRSPPLVQSAQPKREVHRACTPRSLYRALSRAASINHFLYARYNPTYAFPQPPPNAHSHSFTLTLPAQKQYHYPHTPPYGRLCGFCKSRTPQAGGA
jgi:hypothetical protein